MTVRMARSFLELPNFGSATLACREPDVDPEVFFPIGEHYSDEGRAVCRRCPVRQECADWAIKARERFGLYGGLDPRERAALRFAAEELAS